MALRVLLADESVTIKKVIQLALQDFAVEVKAVPVGLDVLEVSKSFQPDLVFADILLQKRSGYEVCADLKKDPSTAAIPVVLMWSSFMELDQNQVDSCGADGRLEKPFEVEALRKLVLELVPRTRSQRLAHFLDYPATVAAPLRSEVKPPPPSAQPAVKKPAAPNPFASSLGAEAQPRPAPPKAPPPLAKPPESPSTYSGPPTGFTLTPGIPERPPAPLGALPDLHLEGSPQVSSPSSNAGGGWNMDSFEPLDLSPLSMTGDDEDEDESFKPIQLPQASPSAATQVTNPSVRLAPKLPPDLVLTGDDDDAEADQWSNRSLDKYRMAPLKPDESLAIDDLVDLGDEPSHMSESQVTPLPTLTNDKTELIAPTPPRARPVPRDAADDDLAEFTLSDEDFEVTNLEIEPVSHKETTRPSIVRELLRDPDFSYGDETVRGRTAATPRARTKPVVEDANDQTELIDDHAVDLSSSGRPAQDRIEDLIRSQLTPQLEKVIERAIEKTVAQMLPQIAERIIKRELERLLEET